MILFFMTAAVIMPYLRWRRKVAMVKNAQIKKAIMRTTKWNCAIIFGVKKKIGRIRRIVVALWTSAASGRDILTGIFRYAKMRMGWDIVLVQLPYGIRPEAIAQMRQSGVDGLIASDLSNPELKKLATGTNLPVVFIGQADTAIPRPAGGIQSIVSCDDMAIGAMGARHLLSLGSFNSFGFLYASFDPAWKCLREKGFRETLNSAGETCRTFKATAAASERLDNGQLAGWIKSLPKPAAIMTFYDPYAVQAINVCRELGIAVPAQVAILGVDNDGLLCEFSTPSLSSIQPDHERVGYLAAQELDRLMTRPARKGRTIVCPAIGVVERESTRPLTPAAHLIRRARQFIRDRAAHGITVADVVAHLNVSCRLANLRFREIEGTSIRQAIEDRRMELAERALLKTGWNIGRIAAESGYRNFKTFEIAFRKRHGMSPSAFRKR